MAGVTWLAVIVSKRGKSLKSCRGVKGVGIVVGIVVARVGL
jgi:hypothetical protein